jgi:hypothetical protein
MSISNKAMLVIALSAIPVDILIYAMVMGAHPSSSLLGNFGLGVQTLSISGIAISIVLSIALLLGLNHEPRKKVSGAIICLIALAMVLFQAIVATGEWLQW